MTSATLTVEDELMTLTQRLIREYAEIPAGAVMRCLARAAHGARAWGCPNEHFVSTVEASTRWRLEQRLGAA